MLHKLLTVVLAISAVQAQRFQNPVLDGADYPDPGVFLHNGTYYAVTTTNSNGPEKYPIHTSKDLQHWTFVGYVFTEANLPTWSRVNVAYWAPEIHQVKDKFLVYYTSRDTELNQLSIGVAVADSPTGPYKTADQPLLVTANTWAADATLINDPTNGKLMLCWTSEYRILVRNLTDDGLAFKDDTVKQLFAPDQAWEEGENEAPWYLYRNGYHYIFYSACNFCGDRYALAVARSRTSSTGPYEKLPYPLLRSNELFKGPGHGSVVPDFDGEGHVFVHHAWKAGAVCGDYDRLMFSSSLSWGDNNWPRNMTIGG